MYLDEPYVEVVYLLCAFTCICALLVLTVIFIYSVIYKDKAVIEMLHEHNLQDIIIISPVIVIVATAVFLIYLYSSISGCIRCRKR